MRDGYSQGLFYTSPFLTPYLFSNKIRLTNNEWGKFHIYTLHKAITALLHRPCESLASHCFYYAVRKLLRTLTISILIDQLKYPVNHLVWGQQVAVFIQLSMAGFLQSINRLRVTDRKEVLYSDSEVDSV